MMLTAAAEGYSIGAFNITNIIQMEAVVEAAINKNAPLIIQTSVTPARFLKPEIIAAVYKTLAVSAPIPICLHLDHCEDIDFCKLCADVGYTNIMIDASKQDFMENIRQTKIVSDYCHGLGDITVEGELGTVSGVEDQIRVSEDEAALCPPEDALKFIDETGIDLFAPAIGTAHGVYKTENPKIDFDRFKEINQLVNGNKLDTPLVVHGGTGLKPDVVKKLISLGGAKFNVSTDLKHTLIDTTYDHINAHRNDYNPGKMDSRVKKETIKKIEKWIDLIGSTNKARLSPSI